MRTCGVAINCESHHYADFNPPTFSKSASFCSASDTCFAGRSRPLASTRVFLLGSRLTSAVWIHDKTIASEASDLGFLRHVTAQLKADLSSMYT